MSRHEVKAKHDHQKVFVGWDHPMQTFFVQVYDNTKSEDENPVVWSGTRPREHYEVEHVQVIASTYAHWTTEIGSLLYGDKDEGR